MITRFPGMRPVLLAFLLAPAPLLGDTAHAFKVHLRLGQFLALHGNLPAARVEFAAAAALAPNFPPAQQAAASLPAKGA